MNDWKSNLPWFIAGASSAALVTVLLTSGPQADPSTGRSYACHREPRRSARSHHDPASHAGTAPSKRPPARRSPCTTTTGTDG